MNFKRTVLASSMITVMSAGLVMNAAVADENTAILGAVTVIGDREAARELPSSAAVVDNQQLTLEATTDINQVLKTVSGVYIQEEDGLGLRPNIGIRAAAPGRSQNITLMEDGVLIAPAPYSNPAAYYFPTTMRMHSIEVLKGAPLLRYGPQTVGGVVNLISTPIPEKNKGRAMFLLSDEGSTDLHLNYGGKSGQWGYMLETVQRNNEGFKDIDRSNGDTGFEIEDYVGKLSWENDRNKVLFKFQRSLEASNETYMGLTDADFRRDENRRYGLTDNENMDNQHTGINLSHTFQWTDNLSSTLTLYHNKYKRDWFKSGDGEDFLDQANAGDATAQGILDGNIDVAGLEFKHNSREYESRGVQGNFNWQIANHELNLGARIHHDEMDRYQPVEIYDQISGQMVYQGMKAGEISGSNNREEEADAVSLWITDDYQVTDRLLLNLSLRVEDVETGRKEFATSDRSTLAAADKQLSNDYREYLAGIAATYDLTDNWQVLGGYHDGMTPLGGGSQDGEEPEKSGNYELGARFDNGVFYSEAIAFYSDFSNKAELCSLATPCANGQTSGSSVLGGAEVKGLEFQAGSLFTAGSFYIPVDLMYTYTKAETTGDAGTVSGLKLQNIPENIFSLRVGLEHSNGWNNYVVAKYIDKTCAILGCNKSSNAFDETDALTTFDLISRYQFDKGPEVFVKVVNIFDRQEIISRSPIGARPNIERTVWAGILYDF
ncbi:MAG: TonB-dependent receptor [Gammaproteobacteria bacterium]|nr:TonB-dependent receptor [Gammaproteobacteria bacterium]MDH5591316.1 TonB-dependent receptor [Gammaproteobacteria bacterium]